MYKIFLSSRNRLAVSSKCIAALKNHSVLPHQIYVYDNLTNYKILEHFVYWGMLYEQGIISQVCFTTKESTFNAFSKAAAWNLFGLQHEQDPQKDSYDFLVLLDNDVIVAPGWDKLIYDAWKEIELKKMSNIKIVTNYEWPEGISDTTKIENIAGREAITGKLSGSTLWSMRTNFFKDVGFLKIRHLVGLDKKHDQMYWDLLLESAKGNNYVLGLKGEFAFHCGRDAGSICNTLVKNKGKTDQEKLDLIKFEKAEEFIDSMSFEEFYKHLKERR